MIRQAARLARPCGTCGGAGNSWFAQIGENGALRWELDEWCDDCQVQGCDRGRGPSPVELRAEILAQHGAYRLRDEAARGAGVLKAFRDVLGLSLPEAAEALRAVRGAGYEGTYVELALVAGLADLEAPVSRRDP
ncbi:hypothetical protein [Lentzea albida]|uniref:hypothetical protein n=1 Tax=Lentzea albida TaxID=65499 RepID=UPI000B7E349E|nr:hypothetical protein [Lentzea albida]